MVIYQDIHSVRINWKIWHIHKIGKRCHRDFTKDCGDIPVARYNKVTRETEDVVNTRGYAYAKRNDIKYKKNKKDLINKIRIENF